MKVVYYTSTHYLDAAIETIQAIKDKVELHLIIEIAPESKVSSIVEVSKLDRSGIQSAAKVLGAEEWKALSTYFDRVASTNFVVHSSKKTFNFTTLLTAAKCGLHIRKIKPDVVHFDTISNRAIGMIPLIAGKKIFTTIHDPKPHTGETNWKNTIARTLFFPVVRAFFFYSKFARDQFESAYKTNAAKKYVLRFQPFSYINSFRNITARTKPYILFFGRLSPYKGIDLLIKAIPKVLAHFPDEHFLIAGKRINGYELDLSSLKQYNGQIKIIDSYIKSEALADYLHHSKFVVCPYRDATQSGVLMTTFAKKKTVLATRVGAFPEYIRDGINGQLTEPDSESISKEIINLLIDDRYTQLQERVQDQFDLVVNAYNETTLLDAYNNKTP